jgi:hypothetical protein
VRPLAVLRAVGAHHLVLLLAVQLPAGVAMVLPAALRLAALAVTVLLVALPPALPVAATAPLAHHPAVHPVTVRLDRPRPATVPPQVHRQGTALLAERLLVHPVTVLPQALLLAVPGYRRVLRAGATCRLVHRPVVGCLPATCPPACLRVEHLDMDLLVVRLLVADLLVVDMGLRQVLPAAATALLAAALAVLQVTVLPAAAVFSLLPAALRPVVGAAARMHLREQTAAAVVAAAFGRPWRP